MGQPPKTRTVAPGTHYAERGHPGRAGSTSAAESPQVLGFGNCRGLQLLWFVYDAPQGLGACGVLCVCKRLK